MTNEEYIRKHTTTIELASMLVREEDVDEGDEGFDGEYHSFFMPYYISPDGNRHYDFDDAVDRTVEWLSEEMQFATDTNVGHSGS